jgi:dipeptidyl-peptidase-4
VSYQHINRKQDTNNVYLVEVTSGESRKIFTDQEQHYLDDFHDVEWLDGGEAFTFVSERSGWRHVHKVARDGQSVTDLTPGDYDIASLIKVDVKITRAPILMSFPTTRDMLCTRTRRLSSRRSIAW